MGWGWGRGARWDWSRTDGSMKVPEAPESTSARAEMGWWPGTRMCTRRERWQGVGKGRGKGGEREEEGRGRTPPSHAPIGWGERFLTRLGQVGRPGGYQTGYEG